MSATIVAWWSFTRRRALFHEGNSKPGKNPREQSKAYRVLLWALVLGAVNDLPRHVPNQPQLPMRFSLQEPLRIAENPPAFETASKIRCLGFVDVSLSGRFFRFAPALSN